MAYHVAPSTDMIDSVSLMVILSGATEFHRASLKWTLYGVHVYWVIGNLTETDAQLYSVRHRHGLVITHRRR